MKTRERYLERFLFLRFQTCFILCFWKKEDVGWGCETCHLLLWKKETFVVFSSIQEWRRRELLLASTQIWIKTFFSKLFKRMNRKVIYVIHNVAAVLCPLICQVQIVSSKTTVANVLKVRPYFLLFFPLSVLNPSFNIWANPYQWLCRNPSEICWRMNESNLIISVVALQTIVFHISFFFQINWNNYVKTFSGFDFWKREIFSSKCNH